MAKRVICGVLGLELAVLIAFTVAANCYLLAGLLFVAFYVRAAVSRATNTACEGEIVPQFWS